MKRFGLLSSEIEFKKGKRYKTHYPTAMGNIEMEILTKSITNSIDIEKGQGKLNIEYDIHLSGLSDGKNVINIEIM